jgi:hypothetical protein
MFSRLLPCFLAEENAEKVICEEVLGFFRRFPYLWQCTIGCSEKMTQNSRFSIGRIWVFFHQKCFLEPTGILEWKKSKKTLSKKWLGLHGFTPLVIQLFTDIIHSIDESFFF